MFTSPRAGRGRDHAVRRDSAIPVWNYYVALLEQRGLLLHDPVLDVPI